MAFSPGSNKNIILVNTSNEPKTIVLPLLSDYPDRFLYIKDVTTLAPESTYSNYITILTSNNDKFENDTDSIEITSQFTNYTFYANPYTNCWNTLNYYDKEILNIQSIKTGIIEFASNFNTIQTILTTLTTVFIPQQTSYLVDTIIDLSYNTITYPYFNISVPLDPVPEIFNSINVTKWSLTTSFNGLLSSSGITIATYIMLSNTDSHEDISGNLFNQNNPYMWSMKLLPISFPTRTTFTYKDTYNSYKTLSSNNVLSNSAPYNVNMYVSIIDNSGDSNLTYKFVNGNFEVSLAPIEIPE